MIETQNFEATKITQTRCYVLYFAVRLARANVFGLRAFARVRWEKQLSHNEQSYV